jgi:hypothetical protein
MSTTKEATSDLEQATSLIRNLSVDQIRERLDELDRESKSLRVLLRSAAARERCRKKRGATEATS